MPEQTIEYLVHRIEYLVKDMGGGGNGVVVKRVRVNPAVVRIRVNPG